MNKGNYIDQNNPWKRKMNKYDSEIINLEANININDYLIKIEIEKGQKKEVLLSIIIINFKIKIIIIIITAKKTLEIKF